MIDVVVSPIELGDSSDGFSVSVPGQKMFHLTVHSTATLGRDHVSHGCSNGHYYLKTFRLLWGGGRNVKEFKCCVFVP